MVSITGRKNTWPENIMNARQVVDCPTCETDCGNSYQAACHLQRYFS